MIGCYKIGEPLPLQLTGDRGPAGTTFVIRPMAPADVAAWTALRAAVEAEANRSTPSPATPEAAGARARDNTLEKAAFVAARMVKVVQAGPDGRTITDQAEILAWLNAYVLLIQQAELFELLNDEVRIQQAIFRGYAGDRVSGGEGEALAPA